MIYHMWTTKECAYNEDLTAFTVAVLAAVAGVGVDADERFGPRKVFVTAAYRALAGTTFVVGGLDAFKTRLRVVMRAGNVELARADLVAAMPDAIVAASEVADSGATYHFVIDTSARDPWELAA
jgi:hypothetical protein